MTLLFALVRAIHFASLTTVFGASALLAQARRIGVTDEHLRKTLMAAAWATPASAILWLCFVGGEMTGDAAAGFEPSVAATVIAHSFYGHVFLARVVPLIGLALLCLRGGGYALKAVVAGLALAGLGLTSHAASAGSPQSGYLGAAIDALHLLAAGFWIGGLVVIMPQIVPRIRDTARLVALLTMFSRWGVVSVAVLIAAGTANAVFILDMPGMAWSGTYVTWLAVKIVLAGLMVALALTNRFGVLPALARGDREARDTIPLTVLAELGAALLILMIVGILGLTAPMQM
ncbi:MAG: CopD family protein [Rhizomicrobium sp.]